MLAQGQEKKIPNLEILEDSPSPLRRPLDI